MQFIQFKTDMRGIEYKVQSPDGTIETRKEDIPIAVGACPKCGAILFSQEGMIGETLHKIASKQMGNTAAYCHNCGENYCVGPVLDAQYEIIDTVDEEEKKDDSSGENANSTTENK